jgi:putative ABC transport system permease protein
MVPIARRNLLDDKLKLTTALVGVVFSVLLVTCIGGLYVGSSGNAAGIIEHAGADLWIVAHGTRSVDLSEPISIRRYYQTVSTPGVLWAEPLLVQFSQWRLSDGREEIAQLVGLEPGTRLNLPWAMGVGKREHIGHNSGVIIDERERRRFGTANRPLGLGDRAEIFNARVRVVGFSRGVGSFTTIPYVFMTRKQAERCTPLEEGQTKFVVAKARPAMPVEQLRRRLAARMPDVDVLTSTEFARLSRNYWLYGTGAGAGLIFSAVLAVIVGCVIVSQTIYAATLDRLGEYGTLKALGMDNYRVGMIIVRQSLLIGALGYGIGAVSAALLSLKLPDWHLAVQIPPWLYGAMFLLTMVTCTVCSVASVAKVFRLPPATIFRG